MVQGLVNVPANTENYDVLVEGTKYDVVYTMVNPTEKTVTDVEFGYYINSLNDTFDVEVKDNVKNCATVQSLDAKQLGGTMDLWLDNELNVVAEVERVYPAFTSGQPQVIADNRLLVTIVYGEGSSVKKVVDGNGAVIAIVPNSAELKGGYFEIDNKYYNLDLALAFDPVAEEYTVVYEKAEYVILLKDGDYYFWNTSLTAPKLVVDALDDSVEGTVKIQTLGATVEENRFVVITTTTVEGEVTTTYTLYGANGAVILEAEAAIVEFASITDVEGVYRIVLADGTWYIARA